jgi:hypothetical protein
VPQDGRAQTFIDPDKGIQAVTAPFEPGPFIHVLASSSA